jgi:hypothetical protein
MADNPRDLIRAAQTAELQGDRAKAAECLEQAAALYQQSGHTSRASQLTRQARQLRSQAPDVSPAFTAAMTGGKEAVAFRSVSWSDAESTSDDARTHVLEPTEESLPLEPEPGLPRLAGRIAAVGGPSGAEAANASGSSRGPAVPPGLALRNPEAREQAATPVRADGPQPGGATAQDWGAEASGGARGEASGGARGGASDARGEASGGARGEASGGARGEASGSARGEASGSARGEPSNAHGEAASSRSEPSARGEPSNARGEASDARSEASGGARGGASDARGEASSSGAHGEASSARGEASGNARGEASGNARGEPSSARGGAFDARGEAFGNARGEASVTASAEASAAGGARTPFLVARDPSSWPDDAEASADAVTDDVIVPGGLLLPPEEDDVLIPGSMAPPPDASDTVVPGGLLRPADDIPSPAPSEPGRGRRREKRLIERGPTRADPALDAWCSFCCRPRNEVGDLVAGPAGAFICKGCLGESQGLLGGVAMPPPLRRPVKEEPRAGGVELVGHDEVKTLMERTLEAGARCLLLVGPEGCGKSIFFQSLQRRAQGVLATVEALESTPGTEPLLVEDVDRLEPRAQAALAAFLSNLPERAVVLSARGAVSSMGLWVRGERGSLPVPTTAGMSDAVQGAVPVSILERVQVVLPVRRPTVPELVEVARRMLSLRQPEVKLSEEVLGAFAAEAVRSPRTGHELRALLSRVHAGHWSLESAQTPAAEPSNPRGGRKATP